MKKMSDSLINRIKRRAEELEKEYGRSFYKEFNSLASDVIILTMLENYDFHRLNTWKVYEVYKILCTNNAVSLMSKVEFSRYIVKRFGYIVIDKKFNGNKHRLFINYSYEK
jgi:Cdc6-like AAA superfamily ATPase